MTDFELMNAASNARTRSYSPYSGYSVGAALLCADGTVYTGCNIENVSFSPSVCAERVAFFKAISDGKRDFLKIALVGGKENADSSCFPCGVCRQVMMEFCQDHFIILVGTPEKFKSHCLTDILPLAFSKNELRISPRNSSID